MTSSLNATLSVDSSHDTGKDFLIISGCDKFFQLPDQRAQPLLIFSSEAVVHRTVDIQHADNLVVHPQREDNFRITGGIAGNVAVKGVDILDALDLALRHRRAAHAAPDRDPHTGQFALGTAPAPGYRLPEDKNRPS